MSPELARQCVIFNRLCILNYALLVLLAVLMVVVKVIG